MDECQACDIIRITQTLYQRVCGSNGYRWSYTRDVRLSGFDLIAIYRN
jgi:hypothetical protein